MADMVVIYTLNLTVKRAVYVGDTEDTPEDVALGMTSFRAKRDLEKEVLLTLRRLDGDCDVEVMDADIEEE